MAWIFARHSQLYREQCHYKYIVYWNEHRYYHCQHQPVILWKFSFHLLHIHFGISNYSHYFIFSVHFSFAPCCRMIASRRFWSVDHSNKIGMERKGKAIWYMVTTGQFVSNRPSKRQKVAIDNISNQKWKIAHIENEGKIEKDWNCKQPSELLNNKSEKNSFK